MARGITTSIAALESCSIDISMAVRAMCLAGSIDPISTSTARLATANGSSTMGRPAPVRATPRPVVDQYKAAIDRIMVDPELVRRFGELGVDALHSSAAELQAFNTAETAKFGRIIREQGIKAD